MSQSQAYDSISMRKKISYNRPPKHLLLIIESYVVFGALLHLKKRPLLFVFLAMTQHHSTTICKMIDALCFDLVFSFSFGQTQDQFFYCLSMEARKYQIDEDQGGEILCYENRSIPTLSTSHITQQQ